jgi:hypothetical protein
MPSFCMVVCLSLALLRIDALVIVHSPSRRYTVGLLRMAHTDHHARQQDGNEQQSTPPPAAALADKMILEFLRPSEKCDASQLSGTHLAYIGDGVYELFVRSKLVWPPKSTTDLQNRAVGLVKGMWRIGINAILLIIHGRKA